MRLVRTAAVTWAALVFAAGHASAMAYSVDFETNLPGFLNDPGGLLPAGWDADGGFTGGVTAFTGSWTFDDSVLDANPAAGAGSFAFNDPSLTIQLDAGGLGYEFQLDSIDYLYDETGSSSFLEITGSTTSPSASGVLSERVSIFWATANPTTAPAVDSAFPIPFAWEDGSGASSLSVSGLGADGTLYTWGKLLGTYGETVAVASAAIPEPTGLLLFAGGCAAFAALGRRRRVRRR